MWAKHLCIVVYISFTHVSLFLLLMLQHLALLFGCGWDPLTSWLPMTISYLCLLPSSPFTRPSVMQYDWFVWSPAHLPPACHLSKQLLCGQRQFCCSEKTNMVTSLWLDVGEGTQPKGIATYHSHAGNDEASWGWQLRKPFNGVDLISKPQSCSISSCPDGGSSDASY